MVRRIVVNTGRLLAQDRVGKTIDEIDQSIADTPAEALTTLSQEGIIHGLAPAGGGKCPSCTAPVGNRSLNHTGGTTR